MKKMVSKKSVETFRGLIYTAKKIIEDFGNEIEFSNRWTWVGEKETKNLIKDMLRYTPSAQKMVNENIKFEIYDCERGRLEMLAIEKVKKLLERRLETYEEKIF